MHQTKRTSTFNPKFKHTFYAVGMKGSIERCLQHFGYRFFENFGPKASFQWRVIDRNSVLTPTNAYMLCSFTAFGPPNNLNAAGLSGKRSVLNRIS